MTIFQTQEAAANFSIPFRLPLFLRVVASNGSTSFIFVLLFEEKGGGGETRDEVNSKRQYTVRFIFETLDDDLSILSYEKRCEPRECAPTEEEVRPENGNSQLSIANESGDQSHPRDSFPDCSPIVSRSFLSDLKVFPLFFFFFSFFSFFLSTRLRWKREKLSRGKEMRPCFDNEILWIRVWRRRSFDGCMIVELMLKKEKKKNSILPNGK